MQIALLHIAGGNTKWHSYLESSLTLSCNITYNYYMTSNSKRSKNVCQRKDLLSNIRSSCTHNCLNLKNSNVLILVDELRNVVHS